ncbi:galactose mutarotase [Nocardioides anomalus]|uniref:Aldose 1-epimerase n=1 Tax=Nocardioides anomalus TaxID=2712223 RepID=A0A6G6W9J4_9ACTN|nr:aldose epimerase family protein [Nocardioides anomalus]QIG41892.1 galactose mutarotase [Nocardioides anomalus]
MSSSTQAHGEAPGGPVDLVTLGGETLELSVSTLGAAAQRLLAHGPDGSRDLLLGLRDAAAALADESFIGVVAGRFANRIAGGELPLDGHTWTLPVNDGPNTLHGGPDGFGRRVWTVTDLDDGPEPWLRLALVSPDGDQGFPGELAVAATYAVRGWSVSLDLEARTTATTVVNLTSHAYWNLAAGADVRDHHLRVAASRYLPVDGTGIPVSGPVDVAGTGYDLRDGGPLRAHLDGDVDHCLVLDDPPPGVAQAVLSDPASGWSVSVETDAPGVQVYTGAHLRGAFAAHDGMCLETQWFPDAPHHEGEPGWPSTVLRPGETWRSRTVWRIDPPQRPA